MIALKDLTKVRVYNLEHKNQFIIEYVGEDGTKYTCFQSYKTLIAIFTTTTEYKHELYISWQYWDISKTTLKHLKWFIDRYTGFEYENKQQFIKVIKSGQVTLF